MKLLEVWRCFGERGCAISKDAMSTFEIGMGFYNIQVKNSDIFKI